MTAYAADTSFAIAAIDPSHEAHVECGAVARQRRPALAGHAAFETYAVLTRLPGNLRVQPDVASSLLGVAFPERCWLSNTDHEALLAQIAFLGIEGGQVYDALVAQASHCSDRVLLSRDTRAARTYDALQIAYELVGLAVD